MTPTFAAISRRSAQKFRAWSATVNVNDYQQVHKGEVLVQLDDDDYKAQVAQAVAGVEAAKAALENNRRQRELQDAKIERALAGIDDAKAEIAAAQAGKEAVQADVTRTRAERNRQEALLKTNSSDPADSRNSSCR